MDTYKRICAKLVEAWDDTADGEYDDFGRAASYLVAWARNVLAEPEPEGPTKDELWELWLRLDNELPDRPAAVAEFWEHARVHALARWGK